MLQKLEEADIKKIYKELSEKLKIAGKYDVARPSPFCISPESVRAIVLGADPSTKDGKTFSYVFDLDPNNPSDDRYFKGIEDNLKLVGLTMSDIYVQNVCQNYFLKETGEQQKDWEKAAKVWIPYLKKELDANFDKDVPVIATAEIIMKALLKDGVELASAKSIYSAKYKIPFSKSSNKLGRPLIPIYRHFQYTLKEKKWNDYKNRVTEYLDKGK
ncbi:hypothetical protein JNL27_11765 [bacterium]|nr:hypothetical protein [bacterium]